MPATMKGAISFGLLHVPISLHTATQDNDIRFHQLCREDGSRVKYKKVCASCGKEVSGDGIIKGFEIEPGRYVTLTDDDFEKAKAERERTIHILHTTPSLPRFLAGSALGQPQLTSRTHHIVAVTTSGKT